MISLNYYSFRNNTLHQWGKAFSLGEGGVRLLGGGGGLVIQEFSGAEELIRDFVLMWGEGASVLKDINNFLLLNF